LYIQHALFDASESFIQLPSTDLIQMVEPVCPADQHRNLVKHKTPLTFSICIRNFATKTMAAG